MSNDIWEISSGSKAHPLPRGGADLMGPMHPATFSGSLTDALSGSPHLTAQRADFFDFDFHFITVF